MSARIGLIVGSGFESLRLDAIERREIETPYGQPSSAMMSVRIGGITAFMIARHGLEHRIAPHLVNYRANVWALHEAGVRHCLATNAVGTIAAEFSPGELAVPDQIIDYTSGRESSFARPDEVVHIELTEPFDAVLRGRLAAAIAACGYPVHGGVYGVTQGPRLETAAEVDRLERDGCTMVGMTAMPEAALARELDMAYAVCAVGVNHAAGRSAGAPIHGQIERYLAQGLDRAAAVLARMFQTPD